MCAGGGCVSMCVCMYACGDLFLGVSMCAYGDVLPGVCVCIFACGGM